MGASPQSMAAAYSVRQIGTNALPWLLKWTRCEVSEPITLRVAKKLVSPFATKLGGQAASDRCDGFLQKIFKSREAINAELAYDGFRILGPQAGSAVPRLTELMHDTTSPQTLWRSELMLGCIGDKGLPPLLDGVTNRNALQRLGAIGTIEMFFSETNLIPAIPILGAWLSDDQLFPDAERTLMSWVNRQELVVCILTNEACAADISVRAAAIEALGRPFPPMQQGKRRYDQAVPWLIRWLDDPSLLVRHRSLEALRRIAPEALPRHE